MRQFKDKSGRDWLIEVNLVTKRQVMEGTGSKINLFGIVDESLQQAIGEDPELLTKTLFILCAEQVEKATVVKPDGSTRPMEYDDFVRGFNGDLLEAAREELFEETISFFQRGQQPMIRKLAEKRKQAEKAMMKIAMEQVTAINVDLYVQTMLKKSAMSEPALSESIQADSPSVS